MRYYERYRFCPACGVSYPENAFDKAAIVYRCSECSYEFFQHSYPSATAVIPKQDNESEVLLIARGIEPNIGLLALPGGFTDYGEHPERTVVRETREEVQIEITDIRFLCATLVDYLYEGMHICVLEHAYLAAAIDSAPKQIDNNETESIGFYDVFEVLSNPSMLAFPEHMNVLTHYVKTLPSHKQL